MPLACALISIHAPVKGATLLLRQYDPDSPDFNPRTREGCDIFLETVDFKIRIISIHAPVKGATLPRGLCCLE